MWVQGAMRVISSSPKKGSAEPPPEVDDHLEKTRTFRYRLDIEVNVFIVCYFASALASSNTTPGIPNHQLDHNACESNESRRPPAFQTSSRSPLDSTAYTTSAPYFFPADRTADCTMYNLKIVRFTRQAAASRRYLQDGSRWRRGEISA